MESHETEEQIKKKKLEAYKLRIFLHLYTSLQNRAATKQDDWSPDENEAPILESPKIRPTTHIYG